MKCPKCAYLGFETGARCRNCGYEFSLLSDVPLSAADLPLRFDDTPPPTPPRWSEAVDRGLQSSSPEQPLPLFGGSDDTPLITIAPPPRTPLAVRRTPTAVRRVPRTTPRVPESEPLLAFIDAAQLGGRDEPTVGPAPEPMERYTGRRVAAWALDAAVLLFIGAVVVYLTLRIADVPAAEWRAVPLWPVVAFLALVTVGYFTVFTSCGGQTIGKMATGIRVVGDLAPAVDLGHAIGRTMSVAATAVLLGVPLVPWLLGRDSRPLHDRLAHTRVVLRRA